MEEALAVADLEDRDLVRSLWDGLAEEARIIEPPVPPLPPVSEAPPTLPAAPVGRAPVVEPGAPSPTAPPRPVIANPLAPPREEPIVVPDGPLVAPWSPPATDPWTAPVVLPPDPVVPTPEPEPSPEAEPVTEAEPVNPVEAPATRKEEWRRRREAKEQRRLKKLEKRRHRILPRTVLGIASMLLFFGIGVGVAGAALYAYYDWRLAENEARVGELSAGLERRLARANEELATSSDEAIDRVRAEVAPIIPLLEEQQLVIDLTGSLDGSVWFVETLDENGGPAVGSAFVVASDDSQSLMVTSYSAVAAGTTEPAPSLAVRSGEDRVEAELYNWDPERDLALLVVPRPNLRVLPWAGDEAMARLVGQRVWAVQGVGGNGVSVSGGAVIDQADGVIQHTAALNPAFRGGPLVNGQGQVVGIASTAYQPLNYPGGDVSFAAPVQDTCLRVLSCTGDVPGAGTGG